MTYLHKIFSDNSLIKYEYGAGTVEFKIDVLQDATLEERNLKVYFYENNSFTRLTSSAFQTVAKFIRENNFSGDYLRATH